MNLQEESIEEKVDLIDCKIQDLERELETIQRTREKWMDVDDNVLTGNAGNFADDPSKTAGQKVSGKADRTRSISPLSEGGIAPISPSKNAKLYKAIVDANKKIAYNGRDVLRLQALPFEDSSLLVAQVELADDSADVVKAIVADNKRKVKKSHTLLYNLLPQPETYAKQIAQQHLDKLSAQEYAEQSCSPGLGPDRKTLTAFGKRLAKFLRRRIAQTLEMHARLGAIQDAIWAQWSVRVDKLDSIIQQNQMYRDRHQSDDDFRIQAMITNLSKYIFGTARVFNLPDDGRYPVEVVGSVDSTSAPETSSHTSSRATPSVEAANGTSGRTQRRGQGAHALQGDFVRTEAELEAIIARLEFQEQEAQRSKMAEEESRHAVVPRMELTEKLYTSPEFCLVNSNHKVFNPVARWRQVDMEYLAKWNPSDRRLFRQKVRECSKDFNKVALFFPSRTVKDCVEHFYREKYKENFRAAYHKRIVAYGGYGSGGRKRKSQATKRAAGSVGASALNQAVSVDLTEFVYTSGSAKRSSNEAGEFPNGPTFNETVRKKRRQSHHTETAEFIDSGAAETLKAVKLEQSSEDHPSQSSGKKLGAKKKPLRSTSDDLPGAVATVPKPDETQRVNMAKVPGAKSNASGRKTTSYWSEGDRASFIDALMLYGLDFAKISEHMSHLKSATQVRNYFRAQREVLHLDEILESSGHARSGTSATGDGIAVPPIKTPAGSALKLESGPRGLPGLPASGGIELPHIDSTSVCKGPEAGHALAVPASEAPVQPVVLRSISKQFGSLGASLPPASQIGVVPSFMYSNAKMPAPNHQKRPSGEVDSGAAQRLSMGPAAAPMPANYSYYTPPTAANGVHPPPSYGPSNSGGALPMTMFTGPVGSQPPPQTTGVQMRGPPALVQPHTVLGHAPGYATPHASQQYVTGYGHGQGQPFIGVPYFNNVAYLNAIAAAGRAIYVSGDQHSASRHIPTTTYGEMADPARPASSGPMASNSTTSTGPPSIPVSAPVSYQRTQPYYAPMGAPSYGVVSGVSSQSVPSTVPPLHYASAPSAPPMYNYHRLSLPIPTAPTMTTTSGPSLVPAPARTSSFSSTHGVSNGNFTQSQTAPEPSCNVDSRKANVNSDVN